ncbi:alpha/beta-hydrolase [Decorospora gaudefroyi]|uniref:Carboxylic ester hydrolase n=1 Tax=Decorospora gaudefroyi TaxID=184978 RepID=A0A6A5KLY9_9PLEO|nr:alpha/beta-hydrolase [Decorospora gaudefroyi]
MLSLLLYAALFAQYAAAMNTLIDLGYAKYRGKNIGNGILRWTGMRYARSVSRVDGLRFTAPQDPIDERNIVDATQFGPLCIGTNTDLTAEFGETHWEDCLFVNVFAPVRATNESPLPVYVFIQGGGFNVNGNANYNGAGLIDAADNDMVVVNFNYRVGPYGFLARRELTANTSLSLNNRVKDQRQALKWVQKYIQYFGGDPNHVTIGGASAGGGSVVFQLTAYGGRNDNLFHAATAESPSFPPLRDVNNSQWQYEALRHRTGCADLTCMATMDAVTFQNTVRTLQEPFPGGKHPPLRAGQFVKVPTMFGTAAHEGINFTPANIISLPLAQQFLVDQFPGLNWRELRRLWSNPIDITRDAPWRSLASDVYGSIRYNCPTLRMTSKFAFNNTSPTWQYSWNVGTASHVGELLPIWNNGSSAASVFVQAYWASFIRTYDPNTYTTKYLVSQGSELESPEWHAFHASDGQRLEFDDKNIVEMVDVPQAEWNKCGFINSMELHQKQPAASSGDRHPSFTFDHVIVNTSLLSLLQRVYT